MKKSDWFEKRFELDSAQGWPEDNTFKINYGEEKIKERLSNEYSQSSYADSNYTHLEELYSGLAKHTHKIEERLTQILTWMLSQEHSDFSSFNHWLREKLNLESEQKLYWYAEYSIGGKKEIDIVGTPVEIPINGENATVVIECKVESDFSDYQLWNYARWIKHGRIHTILKYYSNLAKQKNEICEKSKNRNDVDVVVLDPIYWCEIFEALPKIANHTLKEALQNIFRQFGLDLPLFTEAASAQIDHLKEKNTLVQRISEIVKAAVENCADDKISMAGLRTGENQKGFFNFVIYDKSLRCNRRTFFGVKPSCNILVSGFLLQGAYTANKKITSSQLLQVEIRFYYNMIDIQSDNTAAKLHQKGWSEKVIDDDDCFVATTFDERLTSVDDTEINQYIDKLQLFIGEKISDWRNSVS